MKTPSHFILTMVLADAFPVWKVNRRALLVGAIAPDVPLMFLFVGTILMARLNGSSFPDAVNLFSAQYFQNPLWVSAHNLFHSPVSILIGFILVVGLTRATSQNRTRFVSFLYGCAFHSLVDIATHHDDGPLLLWPFEWELRFKSPVSHWDPAHFGLLVLCAEIVLNIVAGYWLLERRARLDGERLTALLVPGLAVGPGLG